MDPLFERRELSRKVHIHSKSLQKNMLPSLLAQLKMNYEGHCSSEGFIQPQSITILQYSLGRSNYQKGGVDYDVQFQADVCLPHPGQVFRAEVALRSKIGIHAEAPPLKVLIPRDLHIGNTEFDAVEVGKEVEFEVADCNFKQLDREIIVIGRLRTALKPAPLMPLLSVQTEVELPKVRSTAPSSDEKTIVVGPVEPEKKKTRKLKKPSVSIPNESLQIGIDEGSVGQA
jgi:DNA-directed RNA polymerase subunit E'/Rpb7